MTKITSRTDGVFFGWLKNKMLSMKITFSVAFDEENVARRGNSISKQKGSILSPGGERKYGRVRLH